MKKMINGFIANLHIFVVLWTLWGVWEKYETHSEAVSSLENSIPGIKAEIEENTKKVAEIENFTQKANDYKVIVEEVARNIETVQKQLPADINDSQIMSYFNQEFELMNIRDPQITPGKEEPSTYLISKDYNFRAKGTYLQFLVFLERVGNAQRIFNIKNLRLTRNNDVNKGRFQMVDAELIIQAYRYNPEFKVDRGF
jgi:Tfp pilus assembly protein PilO